MAVSLLNDFRRSDSADHFHNTSNFNNYDNSNHDVTNLDQFSVHRPISRVAVAFGAQSGFAWGLRVPNRTYSSTVSLPYLTWVPPLSPCLTRV